MIKWLKLIISFGLIGLLCSWVDWRNINIQLISSNLVLIFVVIFLRILQLPISTYKWKKCLESHGLYYPFLSLLKILCKGFFLNNFFPTSIGGDGYRVIKTFPKGGSKSSAISAVLFERIVGLAILLFIGYCCCIITVIQYDSYVLKLYIVTGIVFLSLFVLIVFLYSRNYLNKVIGIFESFKKLESVVCNLKCIKNNSKIIFNVIIVSTLFHVIAITAVFILFKAFQTEALFISCAIIVALTGLCTVLPISINGIGVVEGGFVYSSMQMGITFEQAVTVAFMSRAFTLLISIGCGIVYLTDFRKI